MCLNYFSHHIVKLFCHNFINNEPLTLYKLTIVLFDEPQTVACTLFEKLNCLDPLLV